MHILSRHIDDLRDGVGALHEHSLVETVALHVQTHVVTTHSRLADLLYKTLANMLAWFIPTFRGWTRGIETYASKSLNTLRGKLDIKRGATSSAYLRGIRAQTEESRKNGGEIV